MRAKEGIRIFVGFVGVVFFLLSLYFLGNYLVLFYLNSQYPLSGVNQSNYQVSLPFFFISALVSAICIGYIIATRPEKDA